MSTDPSNLTSAAGRLDKKSTADDVAKIFGMHAANKTVMITGANGGLGRETARCLAENGAKVIVLSRNLANGEKAVVYIKEKHPNANVSTMTIDLNSFKSIREFVEAFLKMNEPLHILINNAGIMATPEGKTADGYESQIGVNHLGHFLLTKLLLPVLRTSGTAESPSRVITLSSEANIHFAPSHGITVDDMEGTKTRYDPWRRYGESKLANILFAKELNARCAADGSPVIAMSVHPGVIAETGLMSHMARTAMMSLLFYPLAAIKLSMAFGKNIPQGSATSVLAALDPNVTPGMYYEDCKLSDKTHPKADDMDLAKRLWEASELAVNK
eukprot:gene405-737_t